MHMEISHEYCSLRLDPSFLSHEPPTESLCIVSLGHCDCNGSESSESSIRPGSAAQPLSQRFGVSTLPVTATPTGQHPNTCGSFETVKDLQGEPNSFIQSHHFSES